MVNVYSSCITSQKNLMWEDLIKCVQDDTNKVWCVVGDFDVIRKQDKRIGISLNRSNRKEMEEFNEFIRKSGLYDISMIKNIY